MADNLTNRSTENGAPDKPRRFFSAIRCILDAKTKQHGSNSSSNSRRKPIKKLTRNRIISYDLKHFVFPLIIKPNYQIQYVFHCLVSTGEGGYSHRRLRAGIGGFYPPRNSLQAKPATRVTPVKIRLFLEHVPAGAGTGGFYGSKHQTVC